MTTPTEMPRVALSVRFDTVDSEIRITYDLRNDGPDSVVAYDGTTVPGEDWPNLVTAVYVSTEGGERVAIKRIRAPIPAGKRIGSVWIPAVSVLPPGHTRHGRFKLPLPLRERSEYSPDHPEARYAQLVASEVALWVGYFVMRPGTRLDSIPNLPGVYRAHGEFGEQQFVTASQSLGVPVVARTDSTFIRL